MNLKSVAAAAALAFTGLWLGAAPANAVIVPFGGNVFAGTFTDGAVQDLGTINLSAGTISVNGAVGTADDSGVQFDVLADPLLPAANGSMQILLTLASTSPFTVVSASFDGNPISFNSIATGLEATFSATFASIADLAPFFFQYSNGRNGDNVQITISAVPLPAAGLLLLGGIAALGGLGAVRRRRAPAAA